MNDRKLPMDFGCGCGPEVEEDDCTCRQARPVDLNILERMPESAQESPEPGGAGASDDGC